MPHQIYRLSFLSPLGPLLSVLVLNLLLTHSCRGHSQLIGHPRSILAGIGDDIILPCQLKPAMDVGAETIEWTRPDLDQKFVHVRRSGHDLVNIKNPSYKGRTSLFPDELKQGNMSLKLLKVQLSDQGTYVCDIPLMNQRSSVRLVVALHTASVPVISLSGIDRNGGGVILNCDSNSWYPEPEVLWLDGEGNLLSAGPTETVRGPDDLYTVSSRVTVEKRHSNSFTCRVQQNHINQTRETHIHVPDDFFELQSSSSSTTVGLAVSLAVCILVILMLGFLVWKFKTKRSHRDEPDTGVKPNLPKRQKSEDQVVTVEEPEGQQLLTHETVLMKDLNKGQAAGIRPEEEKLRRREDENRVKFMKEDLESMQTEIREKRSDLQQLEEEKKKKEENMERLKEHLENKNTGVKKSKAKINIHHGLPWNPQKMELQKKKKELKNEVENLKKQLETEEKELDTKTKELNKKQVEVQQLQEQIQKKETNLQTLMEKLENNKELERSQADPVQSSSRVSKWPLVTKNRLKEEQQRREEAEEEVQRKNQELQEKTDQIGNKDETIKKERRDKEEAQSEVMRLKDHLESKNKEVDGLKAEVNKLTEEKKRSEEERQKLQTKIKQLEQKLQEEKKKSERDQRELKEERKRITEWEKNFKEEKKKRERAEEEVKKLREVQGGS